MKRPKVIVNCAMSADGKLALPNKKQIRISDKNDIKRVYELRHKCDAVLVGIESVLLDDPKLTVNENFVKNPKQPLRIILDSKCRTPKDALILNEISKTIIFSLKGHEKKFDQKNVEVIGLKATENKLINLEIMLDYLHQIGINKLLVEGGGSVIWSFLRDKLVDDLYAYIGPFIIGGKKTPTMTDGTGIKNEGDIIILKIISVNRSGDGILIHYKIKP
jgi:2,5-diamino-6-(ribosylamino)-4(3H)-pyrimidinone 5'-phosphate reductase